VRALLVKFGLGGLPQFDVECDILLSCDKSIDLRLPTCFPGQSGVGKSTPNQCSRCREGNGPSARRNWSTDRSGSQRLLRRISLEVHYCPRHVLARLVFALEAISRAELRKTGTESQRSYRGEVPLRITRIYFKPISRSLAGSKTRCLRYLSGIRRILGATTGDSESALRALNRN
jgi:hypothetical protein